MSVVNSLVVCQSGRSIPLRAAACSSASQAAMIASLGSAVVLAMRWDSVTAFTR